MDDQHLSRRLENATETAVAEIRRLYADLPDADHYVLEYLLGLDHAVLAHGEGVVDPSTRVVFAGLQDVIDRLGDDDDEVSEFRHDEQVDELITEWLERCWQAAGGPAKTFLLRTGDNELYDLREQKWVSDTDLPRRDRSPSSPP